MRRQRVKSIEEGSRRTGSELRAEQKRQLACRMEWRGPASEPAKVDRLLAALVEAKRKCKDDAASLGLDAFRRFVQQKTAQLKRDFNCKQVQYVVEVK